MGISTIVYDVCVVLLLGCVVGVPTRDRRQVANSYVIDVYVVVDTDMYSRWKNWVQVTTGETNESNLNSKTQSFVKEYVSLIFHQANLRFQSLKTYLPYSISLQIVNIGLNVSVPNLQDLSSINSALDSFKNWIKLPNVTYDHAILMTSKQFTGTDQTDRKEIISYLGRAYLATMCSVEGYSTSVIVDKGAFLSSYHLTHELGHNLGAQHDGYNTSISCSPNDLYLMAPVRNSSESDNSDHPWYFSSCSASDINKTITAILAKPETGIDIINCLKNTSPPIPEFTNTVTIKAGQKYPADQQCQMLYGASSRACPDAGPLENICTTMCCVDPNNQFAYIVHFAAEFTSCGPQKWCSMGKCKIDNSAPLTTDCPLGDSVINVNGKTCSSAIKETPALCYNDTVKTKCCKSCKDISAENPATCLYGDKANGCTLDYCAVNSEQCCKTCASCRDVVLLDGLSCAERVRSDGINNCYNQTVANKCCSTCSQMKLSPSIQNCEYGNKILTDGYCQNIRCTNVNRETCCSTCQSVNMGRRISNNVMTSSLFSVIVIYILYMF